MQRRPHQIAARLCQPFGQRFGSAGFRADVLVAILIGQDLIPAHKPELVHVLRPQPPMVGFALQVMAIIAAIGALNFHTSYYILPKQTAGLRTGPSIY